MLLISLSVPPSCDQCLDTQTAVPAATACGLCQQETGHAKEAAGKSKRQRDLELHPGVIEAIGNHPTAFAKALSL